MRPREEGPESNGVLAARGRVARRPPVRTVTWSLLLAALLPVGICEAQIGPPEDLGLETGFQDLFGGFHKRGRALVAADFDLDGRIDFFVGNPGDPTFVLRNELVGGEVRFVVVQELLDGQLAWGAVALDFDDDGDYDLFVPTGGNEGVGRDLLFRNLWIESGRTALSFEDVTESAGVEGPVPPGGDEPIEVASANAVVADVDRDGDSDLFVSVSIRPVSPPELLGRNILWRNDGAGIFTDVTEEVGLGVTRRPTQHSTFFDFDNDGDPDLYENNHTDANVLWRNLLVEKGELEFEDATAALSSPPQEDLSFPLRSFVSAAADVDNDGWEDLVMFARGAPETGSPYPVGHAVFQNLQGSGFVNIAASTGINVDFPPNRGVMGSQIGDVDGDGVPDLFLGNGAPSAGRANQLLLSDVEPGQLPVWIDRSDWVDFAAPELPGHPPGYPEYPYRTHGTAFVDVDGDGQLEIAVVNGGPASGPLERREPNRLFRFAGSSSRFLVIRPSGDGRTVSRDAIGTRFRVRVRNGEGDEWDVHRTLFAGSAFSAQNGFAVHFGLADAVEIVELEIRWPSGAIDLRTDVAVDSFIAVAPVLFGDGFEGGDAGSWVSFRSERSRSDSRD